MPKFNDKSRALLEGAHPALQALFNEVINHFDCTVLCSKRTIVQQRILVGNGSSKTMNSKHIPRQGEDYSRAVDVISYPIKWSNWKRHYFFGGFVMGIAKEMGITIRWGGDWDSDTEVNDQKFNDLVHFEIKE